VAVRFLHTADLQLGMTRRFLTEEAQARFTQDRIDVIRRIGGLVREHGCSFVVAAGDTFDANEVERSVVARALEAFADVPVPVLLLPGNHDAFDAGSVYRARAFQERCPAHVRVITPATLAHWVDGVEVLGAPWTSRRAAHDLLAEACAALGRAEHLRVLVGHGAVDALSPDRRDPARIGLAGLEAALAAEKVHYVALGDRHSFTLVGDSGRVAYAGSPEPTDFDERSAGHVALVDLDRERAAVEPIAVGRWRFAALAAELETAEEVAALERRLVALSAKERCVMRLHLRAALPLPAMAALEDVLDRARDTFAAVDLGPDSSLRLAGLGFELDIAGFAADAARDLERRAAAEPAAADALLLLHRLARDASASRS
jgi:DNA repair exonuclease SbcCD nuclease subunit